MFKRGYSGVGPETGKFVNKEDAFSYAIERCLNGTVEEQKEFMDEFKEVLVEWFYSGNWIEEEREIYGI